MWARTRLMLTGLAFFVMMTWGFCIPDSVWLCVAYLGERSAGDVLFCFAS